MKTKNVWQAVRTW